MWGGKGETQRIGGELPQGTLHFLLRDYLDHGHNSWTELTLTLYSHDDDFNWLSYLVSHQLPSERPQHMVPRDIYRPAGVRRVFLISPLHGLLTADVTQQNIAVRCDGDVMMNFAWISRTKNVIHRWTFEGQVQGGQREGQDRHGGWCSQWIPSMLSHPILSDPIHILYEVIMSHITVRWKNNFRDVNTVREPYCERTLSCALFTFLYNAFLPNIKEYPDRSNAI